MLLVADRHTLRNANGVRLPGPHKQDALCLVGSLGACGDVLVGDMRHVACRLCLWLPACPPLGPVLHRRQDWVRPIGECGLCLRFATWPRRSVGWGQTCSHALKGFDTRGTNRPFFVHILVERHEREGKLRIQIRLVEGMLDRGGPWSTVEELTDVDQEGLSHLRSELASLELNGGDGTL